MLIRKSILCTAILMFSTKTLLSNPAFITSYDMDQFCKKDRRIATAIAIGMSDAYSSKKVRLGGQNKNSTEQQCLDNGHGGQLCFPYKKEIYDFCLSEGVTDSSLTDAICEEVSILPRDSYTAAEAALNALRKSFPCTQ